MVNKSHFIANIRSIPEQKLAVQLTIVGSETIISSTLPKSCRYLEPQFLHSEQFFYVRGRLRYEPQDTMQSFVIEQIIPV